MATRRQLERQWARARSAETQYRSNLLQVSKQVGSLVRGLLPNDELANVDRLIAALNQYSSIIRPWAQSVSGMMLADVARRDKLQWRSLSAEIGKALAEELVNAPTGDVYRKLQLEQVELITSIPREAAERVHKLSERALTFSLRADTIAKEIRDTTEGVTASRAKLIARTEVSRSQASLVEARAVYAGSEGYIWTTSRDGDVRDTHRAMDGKFVRWDDPPKTDPGLAPYHAGCGPNCRCFAVPVFPKLYAK